MVGTGWWVHMGWSQEFLESVPGEEPLCGAAFRVNVYKNSYAQFELRMKRLMARDHRPQIAVHTLTQLLQPTKGSALSAGRLPGVAGLGDYPCTWKSGA